MSQKFESLDVYLVEGIVQVDPSTGRVFIKTEDVEGNLVNFDPTPILADLKGQEIRLTIASLESLAVLEDIISKDSCPNGPFNLDQN